MPRSPPSDEYLLGHSKSEEDRLKRQPEELAADSSGLLDQIGIQPGYRVADIGCGPHGILDLLSDRVGPTGTVVGVERSESSIELARQFIAARGLRNVELLQADAKATPLPRASFDVVHARLVLVNVPEPRRVVDEMVALVRPGGMVASHEADRGLSLCDPPSTAWDRLVGVFEACSRNSGMERTVERFTSTSQERTLARPPFRIVRYRYLRRAQNALGAGAPSIGQFVKLPQSAQ